VELDFAPLSTADFPLLYEWLRQPHVARWWTPVPDNENAVVAKYGPSVRGDDPTRLYLIRADTVPIGLIQCYRHADEPDWDRAVGIPDAAGIDYLIGSPAHLGRGLGSAAIGQFTARVFQLYPDISVVVAVPQQDNRGSCRALEKAGFTAVRTGELHTGDPSDEGMSVIYSCAR
jgi:RimJ/RimL family protein N-acetyltransferase